MGERAEVWDVHRVRARKRHTCVGCREPICVGTVHDRIACLHEGEWATLRVHLECHALARELQRLADDDVYHVEDLREQVRELYREHTHLLHRWRGLLRARHREQRGRADLCGDGTWPPLSASVAFDWTPCANLEVWERRRPFGERARVECEVIP